jgi:hypothetical protein
LNVAIQLAERVVAAAVDRLEGCIEGLRIALHERLAEVRLGGEVMMQARLADAQLGGDVCVAEAVEAARLREALGDVEHAAGGVHGGSHPSKGAGLRAGVARPWP